MKTQTSQTILSLYATYQRMLLAAGQQATALKRSYLLTFFSSIAQGCAFAMFFPIFRSALAQPFDAHELFLCVAGLLLFTSLDLVLRWFAHGFDYSRHLPDVAHELRLNLGLQLRRMPQQDLAKNRTGEITSVLAGSVEEVITPMGATTSVVIRSVVVPIVVIGCTFFIDWQLAVAMLVIFPFAIPLYRVLRVYGHESTKSLSDGHAKLSAEIVEYVQGLSVLRSVGCVGAKSDRLNTAVKELEALQISNQTRNTLPTVLMMSLVEIGLSFIVAFGVYHILSARLDVAALAALLVASIRFSEPLSMLANTTAVFDYMEAGLQKIESILNVPPLPEKTHPQKIKAFDIAFDHVSFSYAQSSSPALSNVSFNIPEKTMTALVGTSGSGKTTVTRLLMRYADCQQGSIKVGGIDVRDLSSQDLMRHISVVFQDVYLFDDTIIANIRMGRPTATDEEVMAAAKAAHCDEFIARFPEGYLTRVGDAGGNLSGGEKQRISIARAILKDAPIVILDEPTASLDCESELAVQQALDRLIRSRTVIVIAHRLSTIVGADQILVFDEGRLLEKGNHQTLLECNGRYKHMWQTQQKIKNWHAR